MSTIIDGIPHLNAEELYELLNNPEKQDVVVIDVRELEEYVDGHVPGVPLLSMGNIPELIDQFDKSKEYVFVCRSGNRSFQVAKYFQMHDIPNVHNYAGGMLIWHKDVAEGPEHVVDAEQFSMQALQRKSSNE